MPLGLQCSDIELQILYFEYDGNLDLHMDMLQGNTKLQVLSYKAQERVCKEVHEDWMTWTLSANVEPPQKLRNV